MIEYGYQQGRKSESRPSSTQFFFWAKGNRRARSSNSGDEGPVALYAKELLLDQFEFLNDHRQLVLQENKELEDEREEDANRPHPNKHADPIESVWD